MHEQHNNEYSWAKKQEQYGIMETLKRCTSRRLILSPTHAVVALAFIEGSCDHCCGSGNQNFRLNRICQCEWLDHELEVSTMSGDSVHAQIGVFTEGKKITQELGFII